MLSAISFCRKTLHIRSIDGEERHTITRALLHWANQGPLFSRQRSHIGFYPRNTRMLDYRTIPAMIVIDAHKVDYAPVGAVMTDAHLDALDVVLPLPAPAPEAAAAVVDPVDTRGRGRGRGGGRAGRAPGGRGAEAKGKGGKEAGGKYGRG